MAHYYVTWDIDIEADSLEKAALAARKIQLDPDSTASIFTVRDQDTGIDCVVDTELLPTEA